MEVTLNPVDRLSLDIIRVSTSIPSGPAPPQKVPALVQRLLQLPESGPLLVRVDLPILALAAQLVLLVHE